MALIDKSEALMELYNELEEDTSYLPASSYRDSKYEVVSAVAYLIGISRNIFENENEPPKIEAYERLENNKSARIVRNLCRLRTAVERNYGKINKAMSSEHRSLTSMTEYVPIECIEQLITDGIRLKSYPKLFQHIIEFNKYISDRINNCKDVFPIWLNWTYVKELFIMPNGLTESGTRDAANAYYNHKNNYPYQMYINWLPTDEGNILYNDKKFIRLLYNWNNDVFDDISKVSDASPLTKGNIYDFIDDSDKTVFVVDCENSDPYKFCATLRNLNPQYLEKITKIILYDDVNAASAWSILESFTDVPIEYILVERIHYGKSLVDVKLTAGTCREHYQNSVDSFAIVSSDSDFWGLIESLPTARFLVMVEYEKTGYDIKKALIDSGIFYCYLDEFYSGDSDEIRIIALKREVRRLLDQAIQVNVHAMMEAAYKATRIEISASEKRQFYDKYIKGMYAEIDADGNLKVQLKR